MVTGQPHGSLAMYPDTTWYSQVLLGKWTDMGDDKIEGYDEFFFLDCDDSCDLTNGYIR